DQRYLGPAEAFGPLRGHHATLPRPPGDGPYPAARAPGLLGGEHVVQHLVGHRVVTLARVAEDRDRGEGVHQVERVVSGGGQQDTQPVDLRTEDLGELLVGLVGEPAVGQYPRAVDDAGDRAPVPAYLVEHPAYRVGVADIDCRVPDLSARPFE